MKNLLIATVFTMLCVLFCGHSYGQNTERATDNSLSNYNLPPGVVSSKKFITTLDLSYKLNGSPNKQDYNDSREQLKIQLSFKQFRTDNLGICDVTYSTRVVLFPGDTNPWEAAKLSREDTAHLWNDPAMVLAIRQFYAIVEPVLDAWTPSTTDVTTQTVFVK